jgi:Tol biopolymer transport system component
MGGEPVPLGLEISLLSPSDDGPPGRLVVAGAALETWTDKRISLITPDASQYALLTPSAMAATAPAWSPDSRRIAFVSSPDFGLEARDSTLLERRLWIMDADGSKQRQLTLGEGIRDEAPMWSNDGKYILFARLRPEVFCDGDKYDLMLYSFEDGSVIEVTSDLAMSDWEPPADPNAVSLCESNSTPFQRDFAGIANVRQYLDWWQPADD